MSEVSYRTRPDVRFRLVGGEAVILRQTDGEVLVLNPVGSRLLELVDGKRSVGELIDQMLEEFEVDCDSLAQDVDAFIGELTDAGVLEEIADPVAEERG